MSNEFIFFVEVATIFSLVLLSQKLFGKLGLMIWITAAAIGANIETIKAVELFGINTTLGTIMFSSIFLATDILTERYGVSEAKRSIVLCFFSSIAFLICTQLTLFYKASSIDFADPALREILSINLRVTFSSLLMFFIANITDICLYERLRQMTHGQAIWLRNNISTISCNCLENFFFVVLAFYGMYDFQQCIEIALSTSLVEVIASLCDTPFLYMALR